MESWNIYTIEKSSKMRFGRLVGILLLISIIFIAPANDAYSAVTFDSTTTVRNVAAITKEPQVAASGSLVWTVWTEGTGASTKIMMKNSTDAGTTFGTVVELSLNANATAADCVSPGTFSDCRGFPQVAAYGSDAYVVWQDDDGTMDDDGEVLYRKVSYTGAGFTITPPLTSAPLIIRSGPDNYAIAPIVAATTVSGTTYVHVVWTGGTAPYATSTNDNVYHKRSIDGGDTFAATVTNLSPSLDTIADHPDIALDGSNVYVVWEDFLDTATPTADILFINSTNNGNTFNSQTSGTAGNPKNLVHDNLTVPNGDMTESLNPQITAAGGNVYVVWEDVSGPATEIFYRKITNTGTTFTPSLSSHAATMSPFSNNSITPQVSTNSDGTKVYVTWEEDGLNTILFAASTSSGAIGTFANNKTISLGPGATPKMDSLGDSVYMAWVDTTGFDDIFFSSSVNGGTTFSSSLNLTSSTADSSAPQLDSSSVHVVWVDGASDKILFRSGDETSSFISLDKTLYRLSDTAVITASSGPTTVTVTSSADPTGFSFLLPSGGGTTGTITFTTGSSVPASQILKVAPGGTISVTATGLAPASATIYPRTLAFESTVSYAKGAGGAGAAPVRFTVTDQNSNLNAAVAEDIVVTVSSANTGDSISLTARETGINTGLFKNDNLIFTTGDNSVPVGSSITVSQVETNGGLLTGAIDTINVLVKSTTFPGGFSLLLTETTATSGDFRGTLALSLTGPSSGNNIQVAAGDIFSMTYGGETENALVTPNSNPRVGALKSAVTDTVTATWQTASDSVSITTAGGAGGGAGGLVRPGLVINALAALGIGGGGSDMSPPSFGFKQPSTISGAGLGGTLDPQKPISPSTDSSATYPLKINGLGYGISQHYSKLSPFQTKSGDPIKMDLTFLESSGLEHVAINFAKGEDFSESSPTITFDKGKVTVHDPNGVLGGNVQVKTSKDGTKYTLNYDLKLTKIGDYNMIVRAWDDKRNSVESKIVNAFDVSGVPAQLQTPVQPQTPEGPSGFELSDKTPAKEIEPSPQIDSEKLLPVIEKWGGFSSESATDSEVLETVGITAEHIPSWFKDTARWIVNGDVSPQEFVNAIKYMHEKGIIK